MSRSLVVAIVAAAVVGCGKPTYSLVGTWSLPSVEAGIPGFHARTKYNADGTFEKRDWKGDQAPTTDIKGVWSLRGNELSSQTIEASNADGRVRRFAPQPSGPVGTIEWLSKDSFRIINPAERHDTIVWTRVEDFH